jgi:integrase
VNAGSFIAHATKTGLSFRTIKPSCTVARKSLTRPAGPAGISRGKTKLLGDGYIDHGLVFCQSNGKPLHLHNIGQRDFRAVVERAGLPRIRLYDLRHCHATHLARQGAPVTVTQSQLGHRSSPTTLRYYVHPMPDLQQEHVGRLAERLMGRRGGTDGGPGGVR